MAKREKQTPIKERSRGIKAKGERVGSKMPLAGQGMTRDRGRDDTVQSPNRGGCGGAGLDRCRSRNRNSNRSRQAKEKRGKMKVSRCKI